MLETLVEYERPDVPRLRKVVEPDPRNESISTNLRDYTLDPSEADCQGQKRAKRNFLQLLTNFQSTSYLGNLGWNSPQMHLSSQRTTYFMIRRILKPNTLFTGSETDTSSAVQEQKMRWPNRPTGRKMSQKMSSEITLFTFRAPNSRNCRQLEICASSTSSSVQTPGEG